MGGSLLGRQEKRGDLVMIWSWTYLGSNTGTATFWLCELEPFLVSFLVVNEGKGVDCAWSL